MSVRAVFLGIAAAVALASPSLAADMRVKAMPAKAPVVVADWSGIYVGGAIGGAWTEVRGDYVTTPALNHHNVDRSGWIGSVFVGAQYQWKQLLIGVEAGYSAIDNNWATASAGSPACLAQLPATFACRARVNDLFTVGPRLGFVLNNQWLLYGTGGYASARLNTSVTNAGVEVGRSGLRHDGYFAGVGFEYALMPNLILGAEYQHVWLDTKRHFDDLFGGCCVVTPETRDMRGDLDIVRVRLSYKFNPFVSAGPVVAKY